MRVPKPFFRAFDSWWYVQVGKQQHKLAKGHDNEAEAYRVYHRLMAAEGLVEHHQRSMKAALLCDLFLEFSEKNHAEDTYNWFRYFLQSFCDHAGTMEVSDLRPLHINRWIARHRWAQSSQAAAITCIKRAVNWAVDEGYLDESPLRKLKKPAIKRRKKIVTPEERRTIIHALSDKALKLFVFALGQTGCRPGEIRKVTAADCFPDLGVWRLETHKTEEKTEEARIIYLTPPMVNLCRKLIAEHPAGPLFRNSRGGPWTKSSIRLRFYRLREKLGLPKGIVAYAMRHTWTTQALEKGIPMATVAELLGHKNLKMLQKHYNHLNEKTQHLRDAATKASGYASKPRRDPAA